MGCHAHLSAHRRPWALKRSAHAIAFASRSRTMSRGSSFWRLATGGRRRDCFQLRRVVRRPGAHTPALIGGEPDPYQFRKRRLGLLWVCRRRVLGCRANGSTLLTLLVRVAFPGTPAFAAPSAPDHHLHGSLSPPRDPPSAPPTPAPPCARRPDLALACETLARGGGARFRGLASPDPHAHTQSPPLPDPRTALASLSRDFCRRLCGCADGRSRASWEGWGQREMGFSCLERCHIHSPTAGALAGAINLCHGPHLHHDLEAPSGLFVAQNCSFHMALEGVMGG